jgi:hypothetical protein
MPSFDRFCGEMKCHNLACPNPIVLPHQSQEEMFPDQPGPTTDEQTATFLCTACGQKSEYLCERYVKPILFWSLPSSIVEG